MSDKLQFVVVVRLIGVNGEMALSDKLKLI